MIRMTTIASVLLLAATQRIASTDLQRARVDNTSLTCKVTATIPTHKENYDAYQSVLEVSGYSNAPAIWDPVRNNWRDIKNEPLFVFAASDGDAATTKVYTIQLSHKRYELPLLTNTNVGEFAIGTFRDMPFSTQLNLTYYTDANHKQPMQRTVNVNYYKACDIRFDLPTKKWVVVGANQPVR